MAAAQKSFIRRFLYLKWSICPNLPFMIQQELQCEIEDDILSMAPPSPLEQSYLSYITAINKRPFPGLANYMHPIVTLNDNSMPLAEFEKLLTDDIDAAPDLHFELSMLVVDESKQRVGCRIEFRCTPLREFMGRNVQGTVKCMEHMFYQYREGKIATVWWMPGELVAAESNGTATKL